MSIFLVFLIWTLLGTATAYHAQKRGRSPSLWFFMGLSLGIIAIILLFCLPVRSPFWNAEKKLPPPPQPVFPWTGKLWYWFDSHRVQQGPMSFQLLSHAWKEGKAIATTYVWNEDLPQWQRIEELPSLKALLEGSGPKG